MLGSMSQYSNATNLAFPGRCHSSSPQFTCICSTASASSWEHDLREDARKSTLQHRANIKNAAGTLESKDACLFFLKRAHISHPPFCILFPDMIRHGQQVLLVSKDSY